MVGCNTEAPQTCFGTSARRNWNIMTVTMGSVGAIACWTSSIYDPVTMGSVGAIACWTSSIYDPGTSVVNSSPSSSPCSLLNPRPPDIHLDEALRGAYKQPAALDQAERMCRTILSSARTSPLVFAGSYCVCGLAVLYIVQTHSHHRYQTQFLGVGSLVGLIFGKGMPGSSLLEGYTMISYVPLAILLALLMSLTLHSILPRWRNTHCECGSDEEGLDEKNAHS